MPPIDPTLPAERMTHRQVLTVFSGPLLAMLLAALDSTSVATALPTVVGELSGLDHLAWVVWSGPCAVSSWHGTT